jgi:hypothetical protein
MSDELVKRANEAVAALAVYGSDDDQKVADLLFNLRVRIEAFEQQVANLLADVPCACGYDNPTDVCMKHLPLVRKLTEQLETARADAKEAEAYAEELEVMNKNQEAMIRQADRRGDALEAKLATLAKAARPFAQIVIRNGLPRPGEIGRTDVTNIRAALAYIEGEQT